MSSQHRSTDNMEYMKALKLVKIMGNNKMYKKYVELVN